MVMMILIVMLVMVTKENALQKLHRSFNETPIVKKPRMYT